MSGQDVLYYCTHNFSGEESYHGAVTMGIGSCDVPGERTTILGAHHMKDSSMFFAVTMLFSPEYYEGHKFLHLLMEEGSYRADFFAVHYINSRDPEPRRTEFADDADYAEWLAG